MPAEKRERLDKGSDKRYVRRDGQGKFTKDQIDVGRFLSADDRQHAKKSRSPVRRPGR